MSEMTPLKAQLNANSISQLAALIHQVWPAFDSAVFIAKAIDGLEQLELKARVQQVIVALNTVLPVSFEQTALILEQLPAYWPNEPERNWTSFTAWPVIDYVAVYGINTPTISLPLLAKLTHLFTAEFALRPFLLQHFDVTYQYLLQWTTADDDHIRRLASEGIRPRLPWAAQLPILKQDPTPIWPLLERLKQDKSLYVRRSVANNLNDISKDHPQQVMKLARQWRQLASPETDWILKHGLRTLVKTGYTAVYPLLGFSEIVSIKALSFTADKTQLTVGESLRLSLMLITEQDSMLVIDYRVGFVKASGQLGYKVFKWKNVQTQANQPLTLTQAHSFKSLSTRRYYPGTHVLECLVNGQKRAQVTIDLNLA